MFVYQVSECRKRLTVAVSRNAALRQGKTDFFAQPSPICCEIHYTVIVGAVRANQFGACAPRLISPLGVPVPVLSTLTALL